MSREQSTLREEPREPPLPVRFFKTIVLTIINPKEAFLQIKNSPIRLAIVVIPLIILGLTFLQYYTLYKIKMEIPKPFYNERIDSFISSMIQLQLVQYVFYMSFGILLALTIFMLGRWTGGYGDLRQGLSVAGYTHVPNVLGLLITISLILSVPTVQTGLITFVGYPITKPSEYNVIIGLKEYIGQEANLTIAMRAYYDIPLNATISSSGAIIGATKIIAGEINITYTTITSIGINSTGKIVLLNATPLDYNVPVIMKNIFNSSEYSLSNSERDFALDLILFLNATYIFPIQENISIPYIITLKVFNPDAQMETHEIASSFYTEAIQSPDPRPLTGILNEKINSIIQVLLIIVSIWQFLLLAIAFKILHEFKWEKAAIFILIYAAVKYLLIGLII
ncbi:MAG: Yip1 family protein [Thermoproteota archaeon]